MATASTTDRLVKLKAVASRQGGVVSRTQVYALGISRAEVRNHVRALRWRRLGSHCVVLHCGPLTEFARCWAAVLEAGPRAFVDGDSALLLAGLEHYQVKKVRVSVPRGARVRHRGAAIDIRQTRRWQADDLLPDGLPRARPEIAAVRAALWAATDRQATLLLTMAVQQRVAALDGVASELMRIRRDRRRRLLHDLVLDLGGGVQSLSELDMLRGCRERGLPIPDQQACRRTSAGSYYLDFRWRRWGVVVEVDGIQHTWVQNIVADALRHNRIAMQGDMVLRLPVLGLRLCPDDFFGQIEAALRAAGWRD